VFFIFHIDHRIVILHLEEVIGCANFLQNVVIKKLMAVAVG
jgi:hypothetical protein